MEANLPISVFGGNSPTSIHFDSYALVGNFTVTNGLAAVTVDTSQTGVISVGSNITFGSQGAIYTVLYYRCYRHQYQFDRPLYRR